MIQLAREASDTAVQNTIPTYSDHERRKHCKFHSVLFSYDGANHTVSLGDKVFDYLKQLDQKSIHDFLKEAIEKQIQRQVLP